MSVDTIRCEGRHIYSLYFAKCRQRCEEVVPRNKILCQPCGVVIGINNDLQNILRCLCLLFIAPKEEKKGRSICNMAIARVLALVMKVWKLQNEITYILPLYLHTSCAYTLIHILTVHLLFVDLNGTNPPP